MFNLKMDYMYFINETETNIELKVEVPGYGKEDLSIKALDDTLTIISKDEKLFYKITIPKSINTFKISAECEKGILKLIFPKKNSKEITIL
jgi:HSP20 family molecular chaperone IbpA